MSGSIGLGLVALAVGLAPVPADPPPDPLAWGYLGVQVDPGTLRINDVRPGTPAAKAGLQASDEFVRVGELRPQTFDEVAEHIGTFRPGSTLKVEVRRGSERKTFSVRLGVRPPEFPAPPPIRPRVPVDEPAR
jgi:S1-C subfamily serine protease